MKKNNEFQGFLEGGEFPSVDESINKREAEFIDAYKNLIDSSKNEYAANFDAFEKVKFRKASPQFKKYIPYAAALVLLLGISSLVFLYSEKTKSVPVTQQELAEAKKNTIYALSYFSKEWNKSLTNFNKVNLSSPKKEFKNLNDINIKIDNPIKNLKLEKS